MYFDHSPTPEYCTSSSSTLWDSRAAVLNTRGVNDTEILPVDLTLLCEIPHWWDTNQHCQPLTRYTRKIFFYSKRAINRVSCVGFCLQYLDCCCFLRFMAYRCACWVGIYGTESLAHFLFLESFCVLHFPTLLCVSLSKTHAYQTINGRWLRRVKCDLQKAFHDTEKRCMFQCQHILYF